MAIYYGITRAEYDAIDAINHSRLKDFKDSIKHGAYKLKNPIEKTSYIDVGSAVHTRVLEPEKYNDSYIIGGGPVHKSGRYEGKPFGKDSDTFQNWLKEQPQGACYLTTYEANTVEKVAKAIKSNGKAQSIIDKCEHKEIAITWVDPKTGIHCKALIDMVSFIHGILADLKTTSLDLDYETLSRKIFNSAEFQQLAFYKDGLYQNGISINTCYFIFAQTDNELDTCLAELGEQSLHYGVMQYQKCLENYKKFTLGSKQGHHPESFILEVPYWGMAEYMEQEENAFIEEVESL